MIDKKSGVAGDAETSWERRDRLNREARDIVRRLAEHYKTEPSETFCGNKLYRICDDSARLWAKMQEDVGNGA